MKERLIFYAHRLVLIGLMIYMGFLAYNVLNDPQKSIFVLPSFVFLCGILYCGDKVLPLIQGTFMISLVIQLFVLLTTVGCLLFSFKSSTTFEPSFIFNLMESIGINVFLIGICFYFPRIINYLGSK